MAISVIISKEINSQKKEYGRFEIAKFKDFGDAINFCLQKSTAFRQLEHPFQIQILEDGKIKWEKEYLFDNCQIIKFFGMPD